MPNTRIGLRPNGVLGLYALLHILFAKEQSALTHWMLRLAQWPDSVINVLQLISSCPIAIYIRYSFGIRNEIQLKYAG